MSSPTSSTLALTRREAIQRILAATAFTTALNLKGFAEAGNVPGLGFDPNLLKKEIPWPRLLTDAEKRTVTALADIILPADEFGPAASTLGVPDFIDEWVSAPYEPQVRDRKIICEGLAWCDTAAQGRFGRGFADCDATQQTALVESIAGKGSEAHGFFTLFRDRTAGAYFSTPEGWKAIGYSGNTPMAEFPGPTAEALQHIGLV